LQVLSVFEEVEAFEKLSAAVANVVEAQADMPLVAAVSLHVALLNFVLRCHADRLDYVDSVLVRALSSVTRNSSLRLAQDVAHHQPLPFRLFVKVEVKVSFLTGRLEMISVTFHSISILYCSSSGTAHNLQLCLRCRARV
jgi:hypothetical protein